MLVVLEGFCSIDKVLWNSIGSVKVYRSYRTFRLIGSYRSYKTL
jgi:hypothetical protein